MIQCFSQIIVFHNIHRKNIKERKRNEERKNTESDISLFISVI